MRELNSNEIENVTGGDYDDATVSLAIAGLGVAGGANASVAGFVAASVWGGPVGWAVGLSVATVYAGITIFAAYGSTASSAVSP